MIKIIINDDVREKRLDKFLISYLNNASKNFIYKIIRKKKVKVNNKKVDIYYKLKKGDEIIIYISEELLNKNRKNVSEIYDSNFYFLKIIYEDKNLIVIYKPNGMIVHSDKDEKIWILQDFVIKYLIDKNEYDPKINSFKPSPVHRIDRNTEGLVIFAKNYKTHSFLSRLFKEKKIDKYYYAFIYGRFDKEKEIDLNLVKNENLKKVFISKDGAKTKTIIIPVKYNEKYSLVRVKIFTGKMHQIRATLSYLRHPIIGDNKYGKKDLNKRTLKDLDINGQLLFASELKFPDNIKEEEFKYLEGKIFRDNSSYNFIKSLKYFNFFNN